MRGAWTRGAPQFPGKVAHWRTSEARSASERQVWACDRTSVEVNTYLPRRAVDHVVLLFLDLPKRRDVLDVVGRRDPGLRRVVSGAVSDVDAADVLEGKAVDGRTLVVVHVEAVAGALRVVSVSLECNVGDRVARHLVELTLAIDLAVAHFRPRVLRVGNLLDLLLALADEHRHALEVSLVDPGRAHQVSLANERSA